MDRFSFVIAEDMEEERIDKCLSMLIDSLSRSFIQKLIRENGVFVNGIPVKANYKVKAQDTIVLNFRTAWNRISGLKIFPFPSFMKTTTS